MVNSGYSYNHVCPSGEDRWCVLCGKGMSVKHIQFLIIDMRSYLIRTPLPFFWRGEQSIVTQQLHSVVGRFWKRFLLS